MVLAFGRLELADLVHHLCLAAHELVEVAGYLLLTAQLCRRAVMVGACDIGADGVT
jgi:hypothetical protein